MALFSLSSISLGVEFSVGDLVQVFPPQRPVLIAISPHLSPSGTSRVLEPRLGILRLDANYNTGIAGFAVRSPDRCY